MPFLIFASLAVFVTLRILAIVCIPPLFDEMVQLYMARDIAHLLRFPIYFDGQQYMGPLESYVLAPLIRWFGFSFMKGRIFNELFYLIFMGIYLDVVRRLFDRELTFYLFVLLCILPFNALFFTTVVGYGEILSLAILSLALLMKICAGTRGTRGYALLLGVLSGLAFWCNSIFVVWLAPIFVILVAFVPSSWKRKIPLIFALGFLAGLFPLWIHGLQTGTFMSVQAAGNRFAKIEDVPRICFLFFSRLRFFLSTYSFDRDPQWLRDLILATSFPPLALFIVSFFALTFSFFKSYGNIKPSLKIFYFFIIFSSLILGILYVSRDLIADEGMRYFLPLVIPYVFALSWWLRNLSSSFWKKTCLVSIAAILLLDSFVSFYTQHRDRVELSEILQFLDKKQLRFGVAVADPSYALNALSRDKILVTPLWATARYKPIWETVREKKPEFFILDRGAPFFQKDLESDPKLRKVSFSRYEIFYGKSELFQKILEMKGLPPYNL